MNIGKRIKQRREMLRLSQEDVAKETGISQAMISKIEKGLAESSRSLPLIAHVLRVNALWLQTGQGKPDLDYSHPISDSNPILRELAELIKSTDKRGQEKILLAAKDALDMHIAWKNSLTNFKTLDTAAIARELRHESIAKVIKAETSNEVSNLGEDVLSKGKHH